MRATAEVGRDPVVPSGEPQTVFGVLTEEGEDEEEEDKEVFKVCSRAFYFENLCLSIKAQLFF